MKRILLLSLLFSAAQLAAFENDECCDENVSCFSDCLTLPCGTFHVQLKAGVAPGMFTHKTPSYVSAPIQQLIDLTTLEALPEGQCQFNNGLTSPERRTVNDMPKFSDFYKTPWIIGFEFGYSVCDNFMAYLEVAYRQAKNSCFCKKEDIGTITTFCCDKFKQISAYIGWRLYTNRFLCETTSLFAGTKFGYSHRTSTKCVNITKVEKNFYNARIGQVISDGGVPTFDSDNVISGGVHIGFDVCIWDCLSFIFTFELVPTCERKTAKSTALNPNVNGEFINAFGITDFQLGHTGVEIAFPITFGLAWRF